MCMCSVSPMDLEYELPQIFTPSKLRGKLFKTYYQITQFIESIEPLFYMCMLLFVSVDELLAFIGQFTLVQVAQGPHCSRHSPFNEILGHGGPIYDCAKCIYVP